MITSQASATSALPKISKLAKTFDNFEVWLFMSLAHGRGLWPMASCSAFRSQASGSRAGPLLPNKSAVKYRPRKASAERPSAGRPMCIFCWFLQVKVALPFKTHHKITSFQGWGNPSRGHGGNPPRGHGGNPPRGRGGDPPRGRGGNPPRGRQGAMAPPTVAGRRIMILILT